MLIGTLLVCYLLDCLGQQYFVSNRSTRIDTMATMNSTTKPSQNENLIEPSWLRVEKQLFSNYFTRSSVANKTMQALDTDLLVRCPIRINNFILRCRLFQNRLDNIFILTL